MTSLNETIRAMNDWFFEWYVKPTKWAADHQKCSTCDDDGATKACYITFLKSLDPSASSRTSPPE